MIEVLDQISDEQIENEYRKRFWIKAGEVVNNSEQAAKHFASVLSENYSRECFVVMFLSGSNKHIATEILFKGTLTASSVYPREVIKRALELDSAAIIVAHNHPSGNLNPSSDDRKITSRIKSACEVMDLPLHDHLIIAGKSHYSFSDHGLL
ncbi:MAG: DNA repair protein RadC [Candidatus Neomarinimicrobiota bacterium]